MTEVSSEPAEPGDWLFLVNQSLGLLLCLNNNGQIKSILCLITDKDTSVFAMG
jgi:hypothetical protein